MAGDNIIVSWAADLLDLEQQIEVLQGGKRDLYATIREEHGKATAAALKNAVRVHRMDADKRSEREEIDAEAERILAMIEARAPRATRVASAVPDHDAETGEITDTGAGLVQDGEQPSLGGSSTPPRPPEPTEPAPQVSADAPREASDSSLLGATQSTAALMEVQPAEAETTLAVMPCADDSIGSERHSESLEAGTQAPPVDTQPTEFERIQGEMVSQRKALRPHCLKPKNCAGMGRVHCYSCQQAHAESEGMTA